MKLSTGRTLISAAVIAGNILLATGAIPVHASTQSAHSGAAGQVGAQVIHSLYNEVSPSLLSMAGGRAAAKATSTVPNLKTTTRAASTTAASGGNTFSPVPGTTAIPPVPSLSFEGMGDALPRTSNPNDTPPDANGAVGPHNYVETVNLQFAVFDRVGTLLFPTTTIASLWSKSAHPCNPDSDPIVAYDQLADRWVISSMAYLTSYQMCVAVSTTGDPLGSWNLYTFPTPNFPDYQKLAVWSDGYYFTDNDYPNTGGVFGVVGAFDRTAMLAGQPATMQRFALDPAYVSPLPAVLTGSTPPPAGSPGYFSNLGSDNASLNLWRLHVNWGNPAASTLSSPTVLPVAPFTLFCDCVLDPGDTTQTEGLGDRLMYPLTYRNFGDHESLYATHTVDTSGGAGTSSGMRWYELRNPNGAAQVYQQNTFNPDSSYRWMGSVASDQRGDIALGDSLASSQISTSVTYTGRLAGDPLDVMSQGEEVAVAGNGSLHVDPATGQRWGDYSSMAIDPTDNCTFWYTQEYFDDGTHQLNTRVTAFKFPSCSLGQSSVSLSAAGNPATDPVTLTASVSASGTPTGTVTFQDGATILGTAAVVGGSASLTTTIASGARSLSASYSGNSTVSGSSSALLGEAVTATPPGTPTNAAAYPGNGQATVTFGPPASNGGSSLTGYVVTSSPGGLTAMVGANVTSATVTGLLNGTSYTFNVKASNSSGSGPASAPSNPVSPAGGGGTISNLQVGDTTNAANWSVQQNLQVGNLAYKDRTYTLSTIPSSLLGSQWIQPAMASKTSTANPLVTFTVSSSMQICVAVDVRLGRRP